MSVLQIKPKRPRHPAHRTRPNPLYGYGYNPAWPSILSVAHDEANGGRVFVVTDRPCALVGNPTLLPLSLNGLSIVEGAMVNPIRFRLWMSGAVPQGAAWQWAAGGNGLVDPITGHALNAGGGDCDDVAGPYAPVPPAAVVSAYGSGTTAVLAFDRPVVLTGDMPDDAVTFNGVAALSATNVDANTLSFGLAVAVSGGDPWAIVRQPAWVATAVAWPAAGVL
jgi:hypothetical protein